MSWAEIKKALNSDFDKPLNQKLQKNDVELDSLLRVNSSSLRNKAAYINRQLDSAVYRPGSSNTDTPVVLGSWAISPTGTKNNILVKEIVIPVSSRTDGSRNGGMRIVLEVDGQIHTSVQILSTDGNRDGSIYIGNLRNAGIQLSADSSTKYVVKRSFLSNTNYTRFSSEVALVNHASSPRTHIISGNATVQLGTNTDEMAILDTDFIVCKQSFRILCYSFSDGLVYQSQFLAFNSGYISLAMV